MPLLISTPEETSTATGRTRSIASTTFAAVNPPESLLGQLHEDERGLLRAVARVLPADPTIELVLVIDQFEELFTLTTDEEVRRLLAVHGQQVTPEQ